MDHLELRKIKELVIISLFADDFLMNIFVLKGGNALDIAYNISERASIDVDVSMESDFTPAELELVKTKIELSLQKTFGDHGLSVFDFSMIEQPPVEYPETKQFWGGYSLEFKIIETKMLAESNAGLPHLRRTAKVVGEKNKKIFKVDISKFEYCKTKEPALLDGYTIYVYTPVMVVYEKLRAICQQAEKYAQMVKSHRRGRAKDFFDIYVIVGLKGIDTLFQPDNISMLKQIFAVKRVDPSILDELENDREFHRDSFNEVKAAVYGGRALQSYDFYFDFVLNIVRELKSRWKI